MPSRSDKPSGNTRRGAGRQKTTTPSSSSSPAAPKPTPPSNPARRSRSKHAKPSFDVVTDPVDAQTGWVYRTDATPKPGGVPVGEPADLSGIVSATMPTRPVDPADGIPPSPPVIPGPPAPEPQVESRPPEPARPVAPVASPMAMTRPMATPTRPSPPPPKPPPAPAVRPKGWIESGLYVMTLPIAITAGIMYAPVAWLMSGRSRG